MTGITLSSSLSRLRMFIGGLLGLPASPSANRDTIVPAAPRAAMGIADTSTRPTSCRRTAAPMIAIPAAQPQPRDSAPIARYRLRAQELERVQEVIAKKLLLATESTGFRMKLPEAREAAASGLGFTDHRSVMVRARAGGSLVVTFNPKQVALQATARLRRAFPLSMGNKLTEDVARELVHRLRRDGW